MEYRIYNICCLLVLLIFESCLIPGSSSVNLSDGEIFDFIVVGGGTGGCTVAGRLAESGKHTVLLITEGGIPQPELDIPALSTMPNVTGDPNIIKTYRSVPQRNAGLAWNGIVPHIIGRPLGGGSAVNGMWLNRGHPEDYNSWAIATGDESWSYANLLKYFQKYENYKGINPTDQRGYNGPITASFPEYAPSLGEWLQAGRELGYPMGDPNGPQTESFTWIDYSQRNGRRVSSFTGYIRPMFNSATATQSTHASRSNLLILIHTTANRILFEGNRATGVRFINNSTGIPVVGYARARKETIITGGVMDSPALLMRSGIGPKSVLDRAKVPVVKVLPVGRNLQEHVALMTTVIYGNVSAAYVAERDLNPETWRQYLQSGTGPYTTYLGSGGQAFITSQREKDLRWPDIHLFPINSNGSLPIQVGTILDDVQESEIPVVWASLLVRPKSRGSVTLDPSNIDNPPIIDYQFLTHPDDMQAMLDGLKVLIKICEETTGFQRIGCRLPTTPLTACSHLGFRSDPYWKCYIRQLTQSGIHGGGSNRMGKGPEDPEAVVDPQLRVIAIDKLIVADASIMPLNTNANTQGAVYVIAEKAADMILKRWEDSHSSNNILQNLLKFLA